MVARNTEHGPQTLSGTIEGALSVGGADPVSVLVAHEKGSGFTRITFLEPGTGREWFSVLLVTNLLTSWLEQHGLCS